ncbi:hypothetical protein M758_UG109500 [Ceratodon purpureus]|nr:hypothetical protein M758_UG109500 [Ceratodon purpureus]
MSSAALSVIPGRGRLDPSRFDNLQTFHVEASAFKSPLTKKDCWFPCEVYKDTGFSETRIVLPSSYLVSIAYYLDF